MGTRVTFDTNVLVCDRENPTQEKAVADEGLYMMLPYCVTR